VSKIVKTGWTVGQGFNSSSTVTTQTKFIYQGWNVIAEYNGAMPATLGTLLRAYTWGLDLAGSLTDKAGVGALLQVFDAGTTKTYLPTYDGNGNVATMVDAAATGIATAIKATYEYAPFGELLRSEGEYSGINPMRFSSKYTDLESGLSYFGHRYYSATLGRFINRDPIQEQGGINLYGFCGNDGLNNVDYLGHGWFKKFLGKALKFIAPVVSIIAYATGQVWAGVLINAGLSAASGVPLGQIAQGMVVGAITGAIGGGVAGSILKGAGSGLVTTVVGGAISGAVSGALGAAVFGVVFLVVYV
jgi:RHS repeat-associated protein